MNLKLFISQVFKGQVSCYWEIMSSPFYRIFLWIRRGGGETCDPSVHFLSHSCSFEEKNWWNNRLAPHRWDCPPPPHLANPRPATISQIRHQILDPQLDKTFTTTAWRFVSLWRIILVNKINSGLTSHFVF